MRKSELQKKVEELETALQQKQEKIIWLIMENDYLTGEYEPYMPPKREWFGGVSFDFWPLTDWWRLSYSPYKKGRYLQVCIGPFRLDFAEG